MAARLQDVHLSTRVAASVIDRLDAVEVLLAKDPEFTAMGRLGRSAVVRLALLRGLEVLEAKYGTKPAGRRK